MIRTLIKIFLCLLVCVPVYADGIDADTKLMLHFNGADTSTTFTDDSPSAHTVTAFGDAQLDTASKKFGTASYMGDDAGTNDYATVPDSADWDIWGSNADNNTIDMWISLDDHDTYDIIINQGEDGNNRWQFWHLDGSGLQAYVELGSTGMIDATEWTGSEITDSNFHHIAIICVADDCGEYLDGTQVYYKQVTNEDTLAADLYIAGYYGNGNLPLDGHIDELRIQNSNYFSAAPNSTPNDTISVPTEEYSSGLRRIMIIGDNGEPRYETRMAQTWKRFDKFDNESGYKRIEEVHWYTPRG